FDNLVDQTRIDQGLIPLDIDYVCELLCFSRHFGCPIGAGAMSRRSQRDLCAPVKRRGGDPHIVCGNDNRIQAFSPETTFPDMFQKRLSSNEMQWFTRKPCRIPSGRDDPNGFTHAERSLVVTGSSKMSCAAAGKSFAIQSAVLPLMSQSRPV